MVLSDGYNAVLVRNRSLCSLNSVPLCEHFVLKDQMRLN